jgi:hypothetical protein
VPNRFETLKHLQAHHGTCVFTALFPVNRIVFQQGAILDG